MLKYETSPSFLSVRTKSISSLSVETLRDCCLRMAVTIAVVSGCMCVSMRSKPEYIICEIRIQHSADL
jgi:hypothetical protein